VARIRIGLSGWSYDSWRGDFYPDGLSRARQLSYASRQFDSLEVNGSFYGLLNPKTYRRFRAETPIGFLFALKGSRFITHNKKLRDAATPLANFLASGPLLLRDKLGPMLWQLEDRTQFDADKVTTFLELLPRHTDAAAQLARQHDHRIVDPWIETDRKRRIRHALEIRHSSFFTPEMVRIARRTGIALVFSDAGDWAYTEEITAGFVYIRLHGAPKTYVSRYDDAALEHWAERILAWHEGAEPSDARRITDRPPPRRRTRDVYVYFDNDAQGHAYRDAARLVAMLGASVTTND
jgi:uncharacterized protein YecE (DUF72 family)